MATPEGANNPGWPDNGSVGGADNSSNNYDEAAWNAFFEAINDASIRGTGSFNSQPYVSSALGGQASPPGVDQSPRRTNEI